MLLWTHCIKANNCWVTVSIICWEKTSLFLRSSWSCGWWCNVSGLLAIAESVLVIVWVQSDDNRQQTRNAVLHRPAKSCRREGEKSSPTWLWLCSYTAASAVQVLDSLLTLLTSRSWHTHFLLRKTWPLRWLLTAALGFQVLVQLIIELDPTFLARQASFNFLIQE